ncbi:hypothetical protein EYF80_002909 [Liparis tanakae]|uniref:Uncharacterized protein n=1 Tax=Liparis tanakae TaxID=230148 RepID=A0A4Z2J930_9TELE|nr:hypothetical protein EYF80_002909 [Liparis tanakae]
MFLISEAHLEATFRAKQNYRDRPGPTGDEMMDNFTREENAAGEYRSKDFHLSSSDLALPLTL